MYKKHTRKRRSAQLQRAVRDWLAIAIAAATLVKLLVEIIKTFT